MKEHKIDWTFRPNGDYLSTTSFGKLIMREPGSYSLSGGRLLLKLSGKRVAESSDPKDRREVDLINGSSPLRPQAEGWDIRWTSADEFMVIRPYDSFSTTSYTFDRRAPARSAAPAKVPL